MPSSRAPAAALLTALLACLTVAAAAAESPDGADAVDTERHFATRVWPVLNEKCLACHGADEAKVNGGLRLTSRESLLRGGESGEPAIVPGEPDSSLLLRAVRRQDFAMPPKENDRLSAEQIEVLRAWIEAGAPWPDDETRNRLAAEARSVEGGETVATSGGLSPDWTNRVYDPADLWAYRPLAEPPLPDAPGQASTPIDAFVNARLAAAALEPAPPADRRTLIRRVTFDLLGLPPTPEEVAAFQGDPDPDPVAFGKVFDRLLASPHYGEKWGRHWLDLTRYADSSGFANDYERGNAWRYRDYVVRSLDADKPYRDFVREQIAGDELNPEDPERLVAAGFLRMGPWELTGWKSRRSPGRGSSTTSPTRSAKSSFRTPSSACGVTTKSSTRSRPATTTGCRPPSRRCSSPNGPCRSCRRRTRAGSRSEGTSTPENGGMRPN